MCFSWLIIPAILSKKQSVFWCLCLIKKWSAKMTGLEGAIESIFELVVFIVILLCSLGLLPFLKLQILRKKLPVEGITFEVVSKINILSLCVIYFRFGELITYGNNFPALRESVSFTGPALFIKIIAVIISMLLIIIVESFAFSLLFYSLKRYASYSTVFWTISLINLPTIFFVIIRIFDIGLGLYSRSRFFDNVHF